MFILRKTSKNPHEPLEFNLILGNHYSTVDREGGKDFDFLASGHPDKEKIYCFIVYNNGSEIWPLYLAFNYYIMSSDGKTFSNISKR